MSHEPDMSDAQFTNAFSLMIGGLILLTIALIILAVFMGSGVKQSDLNELARSGETGERIQPTGRINVGEVASSQAAGGGDGSGGATEVASGESVYQGSCAACHASGVAGAPVLGDEAAWSERLAKGNETLYKHAIEGFQGDAGMMPPKGGNTSLSDEAVKAAVDHMVAAVSDSGDSGQAASEEAASEEAASEEAASEEAAPEEAAPEEAAPEEAASGEAASDGGEAEATDVAAGEGVYQSSCVACHATGVAGAPKLGESAAWSDRMAKGKETLYQHAIEGFQGDAGMMPPKGGNMSLSDAEVKAAVDYMVQQSQ